MPTYLCHGFRWQRRSIRVYVVVQNLDDAAPEWIIRRGTSRALLSSFYSLFDFLPRCAAPPPGSSSVTPAADHHHHAQAVVDGGSSRRRRSRSRSQGGDPARGRAASSSGHQPAPPGRPSRQSSRSSAAAAATTTRSLHDRHDDVKSQDWSAAKLLEEYDPLDLTEVSRPYAYVADHVVRIDTSVSIADEIARYEESLRASAHPAIATAAAAADSSKSSAATGKRREGWFEKLRDQLQRDEDIRWYVVVNGDEERQWGAPPPPVGGDEGGGHHHHHHYPQQQWEEDEAAAISDAVAASASMQEQRHAQYTHQQMIFEDADRDKEKERRREELRRELAGDENILKDVRDLPQQQPPRVPDKVGPATPPKGSGERPAPAKGGSKGGGLRRLFGRSKGSEGTKA